MQDGDYKPTCDGVKLSSTKLVTLSKCSTPDNRAFVAKPETLFIEPTWRMVSSNWDGGIWSELDHPELAVLSTGDYKLPGTQVEAAENQAAARELLNQHQQCWVDTSTPSSSAPAPEKWYRIQSAFSAGQPQSPFSLKLTCSLCGRQIHPGSPVYCKDKDARTMLVGLVQKAIPIFSAVQVTPVGADFLPTGD